MTESLSSRPVGVGRAVNLLYAALGIGILRDVLIAPQGYHISHLIFHTFAVIGLLGVLIYLIRQGRTWARITFLVWFVVGTPLAVVPLMRSFEASPISGLLGVAQTMIQVFALVLLFQKPSSDWFREMKASRLAARQPPAVSQ